MGGDGGREERLAEVLADCSDRLIAGQALDVGAVLSANVDLLPELRLALEAMTGAHSPTDGLKTEALGNHRILGEIGRGGMGIVYEAVDLTLGRRVALKVLPGSQSMAPGRRERFLREARAAARLHHTRIVPVFEVGEENGILFYSMQYIPGCGLDRVLRASQRLAKGGSTGEDGDHRDERASAIALRLAESDSGRFAWSAHCRSAARIGSEVASALAHAHGEGILHRDVKPSNVILDAQGSPWLADFGLAKSELETASLTLSGDVLGTVGYMPPERLRGEGDARGDIYSLGASLYEMLALRPPFEAGDRRRLLKKVLEEDPVPVRRVAPKVPRDLETIVQKAMAREPSRRYSTAEELQDDLQRYLHGEPIRARSPGPFERCALWCRRNPLVSALGGSVLFLLIVLLAGAVLSARSLRERLYESELSRAQAQRSGGRPGRRFESLAAIASAARRRTSPALRDEAIAALALADVREIVLRLDGTRSGAAPIFDPDLERYAVQDRESGRIVLRGALSDEEVLRLGDPEPRESPRAFSPEGSLLLSYFDAGGKRFFRMRRIADGAVLLERETGARGGAFAFDPAGGRAAAEEPDGSIALLDLARNRVERTVRPRSPPAWIGLAPGSAKLISMRPRDTFVEIFDLERGGPPTRLEVASGVFGAALSADGRLLATGSFDAPIQIWRTDTGELCRVLTGHLGGGVSVFFNPSGSLLGSTAWDGTLRLWDPWNGDLLLTQPSWSGNGAFSRDGRRMVLGSADRFRLSEVEPGLERRVLRSLDALEVTGGSQIEFHPTRSLLLANGSLWDLSRVQELPRSHFSAGGPGFAFHPDGRCLVESLPGGSFQRGLEYASEGGSDVIRSGGRERIPDLSPGASTLVFDGNGRALAAIEPGSRVALLPWDPPGKKRILGTHAGADELSFSADGRFLASGTYNRGKGAKVWDLESGLLVEELDAGAGAHPHFDPGGRWLATAVPGEYRFRRIGGWESGPTHRSKTDVGLPGPFAWAPRGGIAALAETQSHVLFLDPETGKEIGRFESSHPRPVQTLKFSPDGSLLAAGCANASVDLWDLRKVQEELQALGLDFEPPYRAVARAPAPSRPLRVEFLEEVDSEGETEPLEESIRLYERALEDKPDSASALNNLAWALLTCPEELRDPNRALALSEKAVRSGGESHVTLNTLGAAQYRTGAYQKAIDTLLRGAELEGGVTPWDGFFIAMSLERMGMGSLARHHFSNAVRWIERRPGLTKEEARELESLRREAASVLAPSPKDRGQAGLGSRP